MSPRPTPPAVRFLAKVRIEDGGCITWTAKRNMWGYGQFALTKRKLVSAHRWAWEWLREEPIPDGLHIDHLCRNRLCVNPGHMEPVTPKENLLRGNGACAMNARKTHCVHGHEFTIQNTNRRPDGGRRCRECSRIHVRAYGRARRAAKRGATDEQ